jgi:TIR domain
MLSYCWDDQKTVLRIRDELTARGFKVWIDVEKMSGNIYDKMAEAVESCNVVVPCLSTSYSSSENCLMEIRFAVSEKKRIVPVRLGHKISKELKLMTSGKMCECGHILMVSRFLEFESTLVRKWWNAISK